MGSDVDIVMMQVWGRDHKNPLLPCQATCQRVIQNLRKENNAIIPIVMFHDPKVKRNDDKWYYAKIVKKMPDGYKVRYIDNETNQRQRIVGNVEDVAKIDVNEVPDLKFIQFGKNSEMFKINIQ